jgi:hypothetical protein
MKIKDLTGKKFGRLTVINYYGQNKHKSSLWNCQCECGTKKVISSSNLNSRTANSCGCYQKEQTSKARKTHGESGVKHSSEYKSWAECRQRCYNTNHKDYHRYGGRGIAVCDRWKDSYENFISDMGRKPTPKHSLDRIDVNGNYEPSNCRWATQKEQQNNRRDNIPVMHKETGIFFCSMSEAAYCFNMKPYQVFQQLRSKKGRSKFTLV